MKPFQSLLDMNTRGSAPSRPVGYKSIARAIKPQILDVEVLGLQGEGFHLSVPDLLTGAELLKMVRKRLPVKAGAGVALQCRLKTLSMQETLRAQAIGHGDDMESTLSYVYLPCKLRCAWSNLQGLTRHEALWIDQLHFLQGGPPRISFNPYMEVEVDSAELEGLTELEGMATPKELPQTLRKLTFSEQFDSSLKEINFSDLSNLTFLALGANFNQSLDGLHFPASLETLIFGRAFNWSLKNAKLPENLETLIFGERYNQSLQGVQFPSSLDSLIFGFEYNQSLEGVKLPSGLQHLDFGYKYNQSLKMVQLPNDLKTLDLGYSFNQSIHQIQLPSSLERLSFGGQFQQSLEDVTFPQLKSLHLSQISLVSPKQLAEFRGLQQLQQLCLADFNAALDLSDLTQLKDLVMGGKFNRSLDQLQLPDSLETLTLGYCFDQPLSHLPAGLTRLELGHSFDQALGALPCHLRSLSFECAFDQKLENLPSTLQSIRFGSCFNQSLVGVQLPSDLCELTFGYFYDRSLKGVNWPLNLQSLTFGHLFNSSLAEAKWPPRLVSLSFGDTFNQPLQGGLPDSLEQLTLGQEFRQSLERVNWPNLKSLDLGGFRQSIKEVQWPPSLESLTFGDDFNQSLENVKLPESLQSLTFSDTFEQNMQRAELPKALRCLTISRQSLISLRCVPSTLEVLNCENLSLCCSD